MPRLPPSLLRRAHSISPHLAALLPACRDLASARNELRWIREHVVDLLASKYRGGPRAQKPPSGYDHRLLACLCRRRGQGHPLQYVLGSQPFGDLDIECRPGVLIPRPETEAWAAHLAAVVRRNVEADVAGEQLRVLDLCTGTGCVALLLYRLLQWHGGPRLLVRGVDVEPRAVALGRRNVARNERLLMLSPPSSLEFLGADIFASEWLEQLPAVDVLVSNPPYVSARGFARATARSVRNHEPKRALVPPPTSPTAEGTRPEDVFYVRLLKVAETLRPRFAVFEVGDLEQGRRVAQMAIERFERDENDGAVKVEIWRDWPDMRPCEDEAESVEIDGRQVPVQGSGNGRAVFIHRAV
ncbi:S-adenosyl-L-methionine-dependent methyltransferase [Hypoxylon sp. FL1284]|nr:S-adenosyl-L-methionine-dependent methyltransferase [Hypoxylon sp. FL1284]